MTLLRLQSLHKSYGPVQALHNIDLDIASGQRAAIVGKSGSGKTTLLRIVAGFEIPDCGQVLLDDDIMASDALMVKAHRRGIGLVSQDGCLFPHLTVGENIGFGIERNVVDRARQIAALADMVELDQAMLTRKPHQLSGGQQQRVALARALARKPRLMLLDEPFSSLDTGLRDAMRKAVRDVLSQAGITTVLVTHDQAEALSFADHLAVLSKGRLIQAGPPRLVYERPANAEAATMLGAAIFLPGQCQNFEALTLLGKLSLYEKAEGPKTIMLRPEQIVVDAKPQKPSIAAKVTHVEYAGATSAVSVEIKAADPASPFAPVQLTLKLSSQNLPDIGAEIHLSVLGHAHCLTS